MKAQLSNAALPERCEKKRSDDRRCGRPVTRVQVQRTADGRHVDQVHGYCEHHGVAVEAIPATEYCKAIGHRPIRPEHNLAVVLRLFCRGQWERLRGGPAVARTANALVRRGLLEHHQDRVGGRVLRLYRLSEEGVHAASLLHVRHVYYGPGSHVFNTPEAEAAMPEWQSDWRDTAAAS